MFLPKYYRATPVRKVAYHNKEAELAKYRAEETAKMYGDGKTANEIADILGMKVGGVRQIIKKSRIRRDVRG